MSQIVTTIALALGLKKPDLRIDVAPLREECIEAEHKKASATPKKAPATPRRESPVDDAPISPLTPRYMQKKKHKRIDRTPSFSLDRTQMDGERVSWEEDVVRENEDEQA
jgi:hypothetical protein